MRDDDDDWWNRHNLCFMIRLFTYCQSGLMGWSRNFVARNPCRLRSNLARGSRYIPTITINGTFSPDQFFISHIIIHEIFRTWNITHSRLSSFSVYIYYAIISFPSFFPMRMGTTPSDKELCGTAEYSNIFVDDKLAWMKFSIANQP